MVNGNNLINNLQLYRTKYFSDLVDENKLTQALITRPHEISPALSYVFGALDEGNTNVLDYITNGMGKTVTVEHRQYEWSVMIEQDKAIVINDAKWQGNAISSGDLVGLNQSVIQLYLAEKWFGPGAILAFDDHDFQVRVVGDSYQDGNSWVYTTVVADGQADSYILDSLLTAGKMVSRTGSAYEEYSDEADIFNYQTPFKLRNHLTTMRATYDITGDAYASVMVLAFRDPKTKKTTNYWSQYQEWVALRQWFQRIDMMSVYSKYNANPDGTVSMKGSNGRPVYIGAGLLEQISPANKRMYTTLTMSLLDDFMFDLSYNILGQGERKFLALTGEMGMREFDRVLREKASGYTLIDTKFVAGSGQQLSLGGQFVTYKGLNGTELILKHFPLYDNPVYHRKLHPVSGKPLESYRMTFIDYGMRDGQSNIRKVVRKGREFVAWYTGGSVSPSGHANSISTMRSNARDGYQVHFLSEQGMMITDPTTCGELICDAE